MVHRMGQYWNWRRMINTRKEKPPSPAWLHYIFYYGFVLFITSIISFLAPWKFRVNNAIAEADALAALIGLVGGFLGNRLHPLAMNAAKQ